MELGLSASCTYVIAFVDLVYSRCWLVESYIPSSFFTSNSTPLQVYEIKKNSEAFCIPFICHDQLNKQSRIKTHPSTRQRNQNCHHKSQARTDNPYHNGTFFL
jgi:hypothetical protein